MSTTVSIADLKRMTPVELRKELNMKRVEVAKMRMDIELQSQKNHAEFRMGRRAIARMTMVLADLEKAQKAGKPVIENETVTKKITSKTVKNAVKRPSSKTKKTS